MATILIADDHPDLAALAAMIAQMAGCHPVVCHDGPAAIAAIQTHEPTLVVLDNHMPKMNGIDVIRELKLALPVPPPVVLFSADADCFDEARRLGAIDCVLKTQPEALLPLFEAYCSSSPAAKA